MRAAWLWAGSVSVVLIGVLGLALMRAAKDDDPDVPPRSDADQEAHDKAVLKAWLDYDWSSPEDTPWTWRRLWRWVVRVVRRGR